MDPLPDAWLDLRADDDTARGVRSSMEAELARELSPAHVLAGQEVAAIAKCGHCDDVTFRLSDGAFARVHLTWAKRPETPPYPVTTRYRTWQDVLAEMVEHGEDGLR